MLISKIIFLPVTKKFLEIKLSAYGLDVFICCFRVILFGKMFVLMGLTWGTEVVGWLVGGPAFLWYLPDLINFLRAIFLCFLILGKKSIVVALKQKLGGISEGKEDSRTRRSKSTSTERKDVAEIERRGRILARQITQTIRVSNHSAESPL